jgi:formylglycine-generating enzyme required for sulfatase activity
MASIWFFRCLCVLAIASGTLVLVPVIAHAADVDRNFRECDGCPEMVAIAGGRFVMGSPASEPGRFDTEGPQHAVIIRPFAIGKYDVTIEQFSIFLRETGYQPAPCDRYLHMTWSSPGHGLAYPPFVTLPPSWPAICLNWTDAKAYINWLNNRVRVQTGHVRAGPYRLPSEAEWEYAARAGTTTARWWGDALGVENANCNGCGEKWSGRELAPVGTFGPNQFGLYDVLGNVWQWVEDCWHENYIGAPANGSPWLSGDCTRRVLRGGAWSTLPAFIRSASRTHGDVNGTDFDYSAYATFRVARTLP